MSVLTEPPGTLSDALLEQADIPPGPWPSDFELETRQRLAAIEAHQLRSDRLVTEVQLEVRRVARQQAAQAMRLESKVDSLVALIRSSMAGNGHV